jgi:hypothetical protein
MNAANASNTCFFGLGNEGVVYTVQQSTTKKFQVSKVVGNKGRSGKNERIQESNIYNGINEGYW